ncbi:MAG: 2-amino-4-hydroxy-6-hydroxymethyldihydropteridine diphosphokinase [Propionibacteriaceae bacterium]|jgi:2-amino-4-hydroxy-6-hydroxymethyldihydropteridine diphosphokinase|nr:2-amino-4-hydroxy-6-hydroxymethyldihydropteridine diphosphokinase [Propionibacteriaceae bacterium]
MGVETRYVVSLGSNLGDRAALLRAAAEELLVAADGRIWAVSSIYQTRPVGYGDQDDFFNAVMVFDSALAPARVLAAGQRVERLLGRRRTIRWGPRTADIDLIAAGERVVRTDDLTLPHPRAHQRAFVLVPWLEAQPDAVLPGRGPVAELAARLDASGVRRRPDLGRLLVDEA